ncbi:MAG TPA: thioredoxin family protein [Spirochaetia bacterium]
MTELDKDNFDATVLGHKGVYVVDFWGATCEPCLAMLPDMEALEKDLAGQVEFGRVNIQGNRRLAMREKVLGLPTVLIYRDGQKVATFAQDFTVAQVRAALTELKVG